MPGKPRQRRDLGTSTKVLTGDGGYRLAAEDERASWRELDVARDDWLVDDARDWYRRLCNGPAIGDLKVAKVRLYFGAVLHRLDTLQ